MCIEAIRMHEKTMTKWTMIGNKGMHVWRVKDNERHERRDNEHFGCPVKNRHWIKGKWSEAFELKMKSNVRVDFYTSVMCRLIHFNEDSVRTGGTAQHPDRLHCTVMNKALIYHRRTPQKSQWHLSMPHFHSAMNALNGPLPFNLCHAQRHSWLGWIYTL